uniref:Ig-like domain-containing protein n=1 Tax=Macrostomum lignano TaxID=282301 RepID=A0A1I8FEQ6_9PLAT
FELTAAVCSSSCTPADCEELTAPALTAPPPTVQVPATAGLAWLMDSPALTSLVTGLHRDGASRPSTGGTRLLAASQRQQFAPVADSSTSTQGQFVLRAFENACWPRDTQAWFSRWLQKRSCAPAH